MSTHEHHEILFSTLILIFVMFPFMNWFSTPLFYIIVVFYLNILFWLRIKWWCLLRWSLYAILNLKYVAQIGCIIYNAGIGGKIVCSFPLCGTWSRWGLNSVKNTAYCYTELPILHSQWPFPLPVHLTPTHIEVARLGWIQRQYTCKSSPISVLIWLNVE